MEIDFPEYIDERRQTELRKIIDTVVEMLPEEPCADKPFFSTESSEDAPSYFSIWLFTPSLVVKIRNSLKQERIQYDIIRLKGAVDWIRLNAREYDLIEPTEKSHLEIEFTTTDGVLDQLSAAGERCRDLKGLYEKWFRRSFAAFAEIPEQAEKKNSPTST